MEFMIIIIIIIIINTPSLLNIKAMANQVCQQKTATETESYNTKDKMNSSNILSVIVWLSTHLLKIKGVYTNSTAAVTPKLKACYIKYLKILNTVINIA